MTPPTLIPLNDISSLRAAGIGYPSTEHAWRWMYRMRRERGFERAFLRVGRRVLVDVAAYIECVRSGTTDP